MSSLNLYIMDTSTLLDMQFANISSQSVACLLFLEVSFTEKLLMFMKPYLSVCSFKDYISRNRSKKLLLNPRS